MRRLNINHRLVVAYTMAALLCGASLSATAQTTTTTLTPAQQQAKAQALAKQQQAADARAKAQAAAKAKAAQTSQATPAVQNAAATTAKPAATGTFFAPATATSPAASGGAAAVSTTAVTTAPATASKPSFFQNLMSGGASGGGASSGGTSSVAGSSVGPDSANRGVGSNGFASGQGRFDYYDHSVVAYGCLRSDTRVFCDFDQFKQAPAQVNAQSAFSGIRLVLSGGRIVGTARSMFVDTDGSQYYTAEMSPTTGVRLMLEYDDVPATQNVAILSFNNKEIQNVNIAPMTLQANGNPAPRNAAGGQQTASATAAGQAGAASPTTDKVGTTLDKAQTAKDTGNSWLSKAKALSGH